MSRTRLPLPLLSSLILPVVMAGCGPKEAAPAPEAPVTLTSAEVSQDAPTLRPNLASTTRTFRDWTVVCDAANHCTAYTPAPDSQGYAILRLAAGPEAKAVLSLGTFEIRMLEGGMSMEIDGQTFRGLSHGVEGADYDVLSFNGPSPTILKLLSQGSSMALVSGAERMEYSLSGAAAAFLWIDERQGRLNTTTALIRRGTEPASAVPPAPRLTAPTPGPVVRQTGLPEAQAPAQLRALSAVKACLAEGSDWGPEVARLSEDRLLWSIPCGAGAYNFSSKWFTTANDGSNPIMIQFPTSDGADDLLTNAAYDPQTRKLSAFGKGRGIGDCGQVGEWIWTGTRFELLSEQIMQNCLGLPMEQWPYSWTSSN